MKWYICELPKVEAVSWERSIMLLSQIIFQAINTALCSVSECVE